MGMISGIKRWGGFVFYRSTGIKSARENVTGSVSRMSSALGEAKGMISSTRAAVDSEGNVPGQFIKVKDMPELDRLNWLRVSMSELVLWIISLFLMLGYVATYGLNLSVSVVMLAIIFRSALVWFNASTVFSSFDRRPSLSQIFKRS